MGKVVRMANKIKPQFEKNSGVSKTVPNLVMSIQEVHQRFVRGQSVEQRQAIYQEAQDFGFGLDRFEAIDKSIAEATELRLRYKQMLERSEEIKKAKALEAEKQKKASRRQKIEEAFIEQQAKELGVE